MTVTVDRETLRKLIQGWRPNMTVEVKVSVLIGLLNLLDELSERLERKGEEHDGRSDVRDE